MTDREAIIAICTNWYSYACAADVVSNRKDAGILKVVNDIAKLMDFELSFGAYHAIYKELVEQAAKRKALKGGE